MTPPPSVLPRRPLTIGELLDAAVQVLRGRPWALLGWAAALAAAEQAVLYPLRKSLGVDLISGFEAGFWQTVGALWVVTAAGAGLEALIVNLLGPITGRMAARDLDAAEGGRPGRAVSALVTAPVHAVWTALGALLGPLWILGYGMFGASGVVIGLEGRGPMGALGRSLKLAFRGGMRVTSVRILGYLSWMLLRLAFFIGLLSLSAWLPFETVGVFWLLTAGFFVVNTATYSYLAALDACAVAEARFRSEGWDIWLNRARLVGASR